MTAAPEYESVPRLLLTPEQAAKALGVGRTKLYALLRSGQLHSVMLGGSRRIPMAVLKRFVDELATVAGAD
jgi:excisionase family DNA binding protein